MKITDNETCWAKANQITYATFVGKEVLIFGTSCHLIFINLLTGEELIYTANHRQVGDGIKCFTGHRTQNIFAFAERRTNPTLFVKTYPNFEDVQLFKDCEPRSYLLLVFTETSLLVALGDLPEFTLTVWNWRRGEKLASQCTSIRTLQQSLKSNLSSPAILAQLGVDTHNLHIWDIFVCGKKTVLTQHIVKASPTYSLRSVVWTTEGALFVLDNNGCVYTVLPDYDLEKIIDFNENGNIPTSFVWYKLGLTILGPTNQIRHYKKSGTWSMAWSLDGSEPLNFIFARLEYLIAVTQKFELLQVLQGQNTFKSIKINESCFEDFCLVYPTGEYMLALCNSTTINLYTVATGIWVSSINLDEKGLVITENPRFPYAAIGLESGKVILVSAYNPEKLKIITEFHLCREPIHSVLFNECGTVFVVANAISGKFFIIEGIPGGEIKIVGYVNAKRQIAHYQLVLSEDCYRIFYIPVTSENIIGGDKIIRICYIKKTNSVLSIKEYRLKGQDLLYVRLCATSGPNRDTFFYAIPYGSKTIDEIEILKEDRLILQKNKIITGHQMNDVFLKRNKSSALTWSSDGFVILRSSDFSENIAIVLPHHRMEGGVKKAYTDPLREFIVSLGKDGALVCTKLMEVEIDIKLKEELEKLQNSQYFRLMFNRRTTGYIPKDEYLGKCYLEMKKIERLAREKRICQREREIILKELHSIQNELQTLLTQNLEGPDNEKLDLLEFNLNKQLYHEKCEAHKRLKRATENYLKKIIEAHDRITKYMMETFWDKMKIHEILIKGIFSNFEVKNYVLLPKSQVGGEILKWIRHQRKIERHLNELNYFYPWEPIEKEKLIEMVSARPALPKNDEDIVALVNLELATDMQEDDDDLETKIAFSGSDLSRFIEEQEAHYLQKELMTYFQTELQWIIAKSDCYKLKEQFNEKFDSALSQKQKEVSNILQKNARLRHIISEINYFSEDTLYLKVEDPQWVEEEEPELIIQVRNEEVPITPYISPSEQAILDAKAAEEERLRLLLLADDFKERALMAMMNGVLEVRWEDELKKDVPFPKCMIEKEPENFNEDDLRAVKEYEKQVEFLESERRRYKVMLVSEYKKVANSVRGQISKFNGKLGDLLYYKLLVDAALSHETLKITRTKRYQHVRSTVLNKQSECLQRINNNEKVVYQLHKLLASLHGSVNECKAYADSFQFKDKLLEKAFKKDFMDMSLVVQEQATKLYKKRPKINIRSINSATVLHELSKCIMSYAKPPPTLNADCVEFLKGLDNLDMYVGVPTVVDEHTYALICKHRRLKIEYEIKLRAAQCEVTEAEVTLQAFNKRLSQKKEKSSQLNEELNFHRKTHLNMVKNKEIQIVLPTGLVEIPLTGSLEDFDDATLICRGDVSNINTIIEDYGSRKICSLKTGMSSRRKILSAQWEHKRMRRLIEDLEEKLIDIHGVKLTKEIQIYLKAKDKDKSIPFEMEVDMIKSSYENTIQDMKDKVNRMKRQMKEIKKHVETVDRKINILNVDVCEMNLHKDQELDAKEKSVLDSRMKALLKRSKMVYQIEENHHQILMLQTELELLRLKTFPTLKYKIN